MWKCFDCHPGEASERFVFDKNQSYIEIQFTHTFSITLLLNTLFRYFFTRTLRRFLNVRVDSQLNWTPSNNLTS